MNKLEIITIPAQNLREKSRPVECITSELKDLVNAMIDVLHSKPGLGLAAPQVGYNIRLVIIESKETRDENDNILYEKIPLTVLFNPEITHFSKEKIEMDEGCFSVPNMYGPVVRPKKIKAIATSLDGKQIKINAKGLLARVIQHEIDHIDGVLFIDRVTDPSLIRRIEPDTEIQI